jgi:hypothetical protein
VDFGGKRLMTLPYERRNAVLNTEKFLIELLDPKATPKVPSEIRKRASSLLKHYPSPYYMEKAKELAPTVFGEWDSEFTEQHSKYYYDTERNK